MKKLTLYILIILVSITSCNNLDKKQQEQQTLNLGVMSSMDYLPLAVALREGYFDKMNLNIKIQKFYSANERDVAFQSGAIDGTIIDFTGAILQKSGGIDLKITSKCDAPFYVVASKNSHIENLSDLKGKEVAVSQNTVIDFIIDMALKQVNLTNNDINKIEVNKIPLRFEMLTNNKIDATGLPNPFALMAKDQGCKILTSNDSLGFAITGIMFQQKAIDSKKELIERMYDGYNMGVEYLNSHNASDIRDILVKDLGFPAESVESLTLPKYNIAELPSEKDLEITTNWLKSKKLVPNIFESSQILDSQFIKN